MSQTSQIFSRSEKSALKNSQVGSIPVAADKKFPRTEIVGDFSFIPTNAIDSISMVGSLELRKIRLPTATKSVKKGFKVIAKW